MSSSWTERQGHVGDLRHQSKEQLQELLLRQNKILSNKILLQTLPDKGKKLREFAESVRSAIERRDEEERKQSLVSAATEEFQSRYQQAFTAQRRGIQNTPEATGSVVQERQTSPVSTHVQETNKDKQQDQLVCQGAALGASLTSAGTNEADLVDAMERVRLSETAHVSSGTKEPSKSTGSDNYFLRTQTPKKPHHVTVLERTEKLPAPVRQKFRTNQLPHKHDNSSSGSSSPSKSSEDLLSPLSAEARREQDKKHLDDITAAKLPPLHHLPAQLLSLQESAALLKEQTKRQQELQAKHAAQKLCEGLKMSLGTYSPDGSPTAAYRDGAQLSSEED